MTLTHTPRPQWLTFDCYGTLTRFQMSETAQKIYADRVSAEDMPIGLAGTA